MYDYQRKMSAIPATTGYPGARRALPKPMAREPGAEMGEFDARKAIETQSRIRDIEQAQHEIDMERETLGLMRKENLYGNIATVGAIGLEGLGAWEAREAEEEEARRWAGRKKEYDLLIESWNKSPERYQKIMGAIFDKYFPRAYSTPTVERKSPMPRLTPQFGGSR